jgi:Hint domain
MKKTLFYPLLLIVIASTLAACAPSSAGTPVVSTPIISTAIVSTAAAGGGESISITGLPPDPTVAPSVPTPIPTVPGGLGPTELKYRLLAQFPDFFFCDPDTYPVATANEMDRATQLFPELQADPEEFNAILAHNNLAGLSTFSDDQKLLIYRQYKKLAAIQFQLTPAGYQFQLQVAKTGASGERITGLIDGQGVITGQQTTPSIATCPVCLAIGTLIDTPAGALPVQDLRLGMQVWTLDKTGVRVAQPLVRVSRTIVPANHRVVHLVLEDGRVLWVSPGHPTADGRRVGQLQVGDLLDGAGVASFELVPYTAPATFDLLPAGDTGFYWANGVLLASTLSDPPK